MTRLIKRMSGPGRIALALVFAVGLSALTSQMPPAHANGVGLNPGDVLAGVGNNQIRHFTSTGTLLDTLTNGGSGSEDAGMCFDKQNNLYATYFQNNALSTFNPSGALTNASFGSGFNAHPESCAVDVNGDIYVGQADGSAQVLKFSSTGAPLASYSPARENRGTDWIDLAADQCTLFYTSEGSSVKRFNVCTSTQLPDFATGLSGPCYAVRIRPNGEVMVACTQNLYRLSPTGTVLQTYSTATYGESSFFFAANLDPDTTSVWTAGFGSGNIYKLDIATGNVLQKFTTPINISLAGLAIVGEIAVGKDATPPSCGISQVVAGPPKQLIIAVQDSDGGLAAPPNGIVVTSSTNATVSIPSYAEGTTSEVDVTATKVDQTQGSTVGLRVTDVAGNVTNCDPAILNVDRSTGKPASTVAHGIAKSEHLVHIYNGTPGISTLTVDVNGKHFQVSNLGAGQKATIDIGSALVAGANNVTLTATGQPGGSVIAVVGDR